MCEHLQKHSYWHSLQILICKAYLLAITHLTTVLNLQKLIMDEISLSYAKNKNKMHQGRLLQMA